MGEVITEEMAGMGSKVDKVREHTEDKERVVVITVTAISKQREVIQHKHGEDPNALGHRNKIAATEGG